MSLRPVGVARHAMVLAALAGAFLLVARSTGSGWLIVLLCGAAGTLVVGLVWPALALARASVEVSGPRDGTVGRPLALDVVVRRGGLVRVQLTGVDAQPVRAEAPCQGQVLATPVRRGITTAMGVDLVSAAPLGLFSWRRRLGVTLPTAIEVGPRPFDVSLADVVMAGEAGTDAIPRGRVGHESVRSVREYVAGDPIRLIHWPSTAHRGELLVKEMENPDAPVLVLQVDLRGAGEAAEAAASRAAGIAIAAFRSGLPVTMLTAEASGPVAGSVAGAVEAGRRLARAVAGPPAEVPRGAGTAVVRVTAR
jgi:uncharacterized protein (DUF58 family)